MKLIVERVFEKIVILEKEDCSHIEVDITVLPSGIKEGNILIFDGVNYRLDAEEENEIRKRIIEKQRSVFKK